MKHACFAVVSLLVGAHTAAGQDFQVGARAKGMGGSYTAFEDDPVSIWLNPAGIARQGTKGALHYQTFTQYELERGSSFVGRQGEPEWGFTDPPIVPSFAGASFALGESSRQAAAVALIRPFENRLTYDFPAPPAAVAQTDQQFWRFRAAYAYALLGSNDPGWFPHVSLGGAFDVGYTRYRFKSYSSTGIVIDDIDDTNSRAGFGGGLFATVFDDHDALRLDLGVAYQSPVNFKLQQDETTFASWDWPPMINAGLTSYLIGQRLRLTVDVQWIAWDRATKDSSDPAAPSIENTLNYSVGAEYQVQVGEGTWLLPRAGFRRYDAPWSDEDDLPAIGLARLTVDTDAGKFNVVTLGLGLRWTGEGGKLRGFDTGIEIGGDVPNFSVGYTHSF